MALDLDGLVRTTLVDGRPHVLVRPGISLCLYSTASLAELCKCAADALEAYLAFIPPGTMQSYLSDAGLYKPLNAKRVVTDLKKLRSVSAKNSVFRLEYSQAALGEVGSHAFFLDASALEGDSPKTNLVRLEFPVEALERPGPDRLIDFVAHIAGCVPFQSGHAGLALKRSQVFFAESTSLINAMLPRYLGMDPSYHAARFKMRGHTFGAHWIDLLGADLLVALGGLEAVESALPEVVVRPGGDGVMLQGAKLPPVGDVHRKAADVGRLPEVAGWLKPTRLEIKGLGQPSEVFDAMAWLARFDALPVQPWDNSNP